MPLYVYFLMLYQSCYLILYCILSFCCCEYSGADPAAPLLAEHGVSPLVLAVKSGCNQALRALLDGGADPNYNPPPPAVTNRGLDGDESAAYYGSLGSASPLAIAVANNSFEAVRLLLERGAKVTKEENEALLLRKAQMLNTSGGGGAPSGYAAFPGLQQQQPQQPPFGAYNAYGAYPGGYPGPQQQQPPPMYAGNPGSMSSMHQHQQPQQQQDPQQVLQQLQSIIAAGNSAGSNPKAAAASAHLASMTGGLDAGHGHGSGGFAGNPYAGQNFGGAYGNVTPLPHGTYPGAPGAYPGAPGAYPGAPGAYPGAPGANGGYGGFNPAAAPAAAAGATVGGVAGAGFNPAAYGLSPSPSNPYLNHSSAGGSAGAGTGMFMGKPTGGAAAGGGAGGGLSSGSASRDQQALLRMLMNPDADPRAGVSTPEVGAGEGRGRGK